MVPIVLSRLQVLPILRAREEGRQTARTTLDLGISEVDVSIEPDGVVFSDGARLGWPDLDEIEASPTKCFVVENGAIREIRVYSESIGRVYSLMPTAGAPTLLISGIPMHRIKGADPWSDTLAKIKAISPVVGRVLDTATGLGYTAIAAAKTAEAIVTIELDPAVLDVARFNPWSRALFTNQKITQRIGDSFDVVSEFEDGFFTRIVHDPPMFSLAGELYSEDFYRELRRVLRRGGKLFHYIGNPESKSGQSVTAGVIRRLQRAGFSRVTRRPEAFGVVAIW
jgi:predicted methyltransferase